MEDKLVVTSGEGEGGGYYRVGEGGTNYWV